MPPVIALIAAGFAVGATTTAFVISVALLTAISTGISLVIGAVSGLLHKQPTGTSVTNDAQNQSVSVRQPAAARRVIYGKRGGAGGIITYLAVSGPKHEYLHIVITFTGHQVEAIDTVYFDDYALVLDGSGNETVKYAGVCLVEKKLGAPGEAAFPGLVTDTAALGASKWTSAHRQDGCAAIHVRMKFDQNKYPNGAPAIRADIRGKNDIYDPRTATRGYTANWALCVRDYLSDARFGFGQADSQFNDTLFIAAANLSDEAVPLLAGGTENRYEANGTFETSQTRGDVLRGLLTAGFGKLSYVGGQWSLYGGAWRSSVVSLTDDDFAGGLSYTTLLSRRDLCSGVKGIFLNPAAGWQPQDFPAMARAAYVAQDNGFTGVTERRMWATATAYLVNDAVMNRGYAYVCTTGHTSGAGNEPGNSAGWGSDWVLAGQPIWKDVEYPFTTSAPAAQRLAKMELEFNRRQISAAAPFKLKGYNAQAPEVLDITHAHSAWVSKTFEVESSALVLVEDGAIAVNATLHETDANVYAWSTADEQTLGGSPVISVTDPATVAPVTSLTAISGPATALTRADGIRITRVELTWNSPADAFVTSAGKIFVEFKKTADTDWTAVSELDGAVQLTYVPGVDDGVSYDFRVRAQNVSKVFSAYATVTGHVASSVISHISQQALTGVTAGNRNSAIVGGVSPLTATDAGSSDTISIAAFQLQLGFGRVSYNAGSITGLARSTLYYVYCVDAVFAGGAVTYLSTTSFDVVVAGPDNVYVGAITTPAAGGGGTGGTDLGGGCCCLNQFVSAERTIEFVEEEDNFDCHAGMGEVYKHPVEQAGNPKLRPCVHLVAENGCEWKGSFDTDVHPLGGPVGGIKAVFSKGERLLTDNEGVIEYSAIADVKPLGMQWVREIYLGKREFAAGCSATKRVFTHNSPVAAK